MPALTHKHKSHCALLAALGLAHGTRVIEWHTWGEVEVPGTELDYDTELLALGPYFYWPLDETAGAVAEDATPNNRDGSLADLTGATLGATGIVFDGSGTGGASIGLGAWQPDNKSIAVTVATTHNSATARYIAGRRNNWYLYLSNGAVLFRGMRSSGHTWTIIGPDIDDGAEHTIVATFDAPIMRLYVDGVLVGTETTIDTLYDSSNHLSVGYPPGGGLSQFIGRIHRFAVWESAVPAVDVTTLQTAIEGLPATFELGWALDEERSDALVTYSVQTGRSNPLEATRPLQASVQLARSLLTGDLPAAGERFRLTLSEAVGDALGMDEAERPRFTGEITDSDTTWRHDWTVIQLTALGRSTRFTRIPLTSTRPEEVDGERARRLLRQAQRTIDLEIGTVDPGRFDVLAEDYAGRTVGAAFDQLRTDSLGQLVEHRSGRLDWQDVDHRAGVTPSVALTGADHLIVPFRWLQTVSTVQNVAEITWGALGKQETVRDAGSVDDLGPYPAQLSTRLAAEIDAAGLGSLIVGRYARPSWVLPEVTVEVVRTAGILAAGAVLSLNHSDKVTASGLPPDGPFTDGDLFVEGTTEAANASAWTVSLAVSDPTISGTGLRWVDLEPFTQWLDVDPELTWLDLATITDPTLLGPNGFRAGFPDTTFDATFNGGDPDTADTEYVTTINGGTP